MADRSDRGLTRRQLLAGGLGLVAATAAGGVLNVAWRQFAREDLIPGEPPDLQLPPREWSTDDDLLEFAVAGDTGSGGRQAMAVAEQLALSYRDVPFGLLSLLGDVVYYGPVEERFDDTVVAPFSPLIDAGVDFEIAVGNHDGTLFLGDERLEQVERTVQRLGTPGRYYATTHGPVDFFYLDTVAMVRRDEAAVRQLSWLDTALRKATRPWRIVCLHHPVYSSGRHGRTATLVDRLEPILVHHDVDLCLAGHDHHYERTEPINGIVHVVSGAGCKLTPVDPLPFSAVAISTLQFMRLTATPDRLRGRSLGVDGRLLDEFTLHRSGERT